MKPVTVTGFIIIYNDIILCQGFFWFTKQKIEIDCFL